jgi:hypothetical protein
MTRVQQLEVRRFTKNMWSMLRYAGEKHPRPVYSADIPGARGTRGSWTPTANILASRGFLTLERSHSSRSPQAWDHARLTDAGLEAVNSRPEDRRLPRGRAKYWGGAA